MNASSDGCTSPAIHKTAGSNGAYNPPTDTRNPSFSIGQLALNQDQEDANQSFRAFQARSPPELVPENAIEGISLCAFFDRFVTGPRRPETATGYLEELPSLLMRASRRYPVLHSVLNALSLALYGISHKSENIIARGRLAYDASLRMLSELIPNSHSKVSVDELTVSVLLCGFYEYVMCLFEQRSFSNTHEMGLISLMRARSRCPPQEEMSSRVFFATRHQITSQCIDTSQSASEMLGDHAFIVEANDAGAKLTRDAIKVADFLASVKQSQDDTSQYRLLSMLQHGLAIEDSLIHWPDTIPSSWQCSRREDPTWTNAYSYRGMVHTYHDIHVASVWNFYRRIRIALLNAVAELATSAVERGAMDCERVKARAIKSIQALADDICATVPFHMGNWTPALPENKVRFPSLENRDAELIHRRTALVCGWFLMLLPLSRLKKVACLGPNQIQWVAEQFSRAASIAGSRYYVPGSVVEELLSETFPAFAYAQPINVRNLADYDTITSHPTHTDRITPDAISLQMLSPTITTPLSAAPASQQQAAPSREGAPRCWEHDCRGRKFTNWSNLNRHRREKAARRWSCDVCGAKFTRRSAQNVHIVQQRCHQRAQSPKKAIS